MIKRFLCCFSVVFALSVPVSRVYAEPTVEEATLQTVSNALYQMVFDTEGNASYVPVLLPYGVENFWEARTIWQILNDMGLDAANTAGNAWLDSTWIWTILQDLGYGEPDEWYQSFHFYEGKRMADVLQDEEFFRQLGSSITENALSDLVYNSDKVSKGIGNLLPLFAVAPFLRSCGGGGGGSSIPQDIAITITNIWDGIITNNVAVSNILDVLTNPNSRQTNVLNISLTNISHYASNTVDVATQIRDILKEILENQTNHNDGLDTSINWMTNNWPDAMVAPPGGGGDSSNDVWSVWIPGSWSTETEFYRVPSIRWELVDDDFGNSFWRPMYRDSLYQPDNFYQTYQTELMSLLQDYRTNGIDGQQFVAGLLFLQSRMMGQVSTQLYMLHEKIGITKTNLWDSINDEVNWVRDNAESVKTEVESKQYDVQSIFNHADVSLISTYFPKVQQSISKLNTTSGDPVLRIPLPSVFGSGSASDVWVVDVREIRGYDSLRDFVRWVCICIWSIILLRSFAVPVLVVVCLAARFADCSCGLLFTDTTTGCHVFGNIVGSWADFTLNLIGLDTRLKRYAVGAEAL